MKIEIVTHCYAGDIPQFAYMLDYQLKSLHSGLSGKWHQITVCCCSEDLLTVQVIKDHFELLRGRIKIMSLNRGELFRRSIGRNRAALNTSADLVWFTDADHWFTDQCFDHLINVHRSLRKDPVLLWPGTVMKTIGTEWGDRLPNSINDPVDYESARYSRAIGGVQIVNGNYCREFGYLNGHRKWMKPTDGIRPFPDFRDDVAFRKAAGRHGDQIEIDVPGIRRIRHSRVTYK